MNVIMQTQLIRTTIIVNKIVIDGPIQNLHVMCKVHTIESGFLFPTSSNLSIKFSRMSITARARTDRVIITLPYC